MQLFYCPGLPNGDDFLDYEESQHCAKVLRKKAGETIDITDGKGTFYQGIIMEISPKKCRFEVISSQYESAPNYKVHIAISPTKNTDRMEWFIEKAVEIGIHKVTFIHTNNSERKNINLDRIRKKAISAMKQSMRAYLPEINALEQFDDFVGKAAYNQSFIAHLKDTHTPYLHHSATAKSNYLILIGPEGGFTQDELNLAQLKNFEMVKIGNHRLRTETAGIVACSILNQINHL